MNNRQIAIATMTAAFAASMVSAHLPDAETALRQMGRPYQMTDAKSRAAGSALNFSKIEEWSKNLEGSNAHAGTTSEFYCKHGEFGDITQYWRGNWYPDLGDEPGEFADSGGTSAWGLINSSAFSKNGGSYVWTGWNSGLKKYETQHDGTDYGLKDVENGSWGDQIDKKGIGAYVPAWRDGAEGAYSMIHDDIGAMSFAKSVQPANEVGYKHPKIRVGWGVFVRDMDDAEWEGAKKMAMDGHEMLNHSWDHTSAADQWQWGMAPGGAQKDGDTLSFDDPALPSQIRGLIVGATSESYPKTISFKIPYTRYIDDDMDKEVICSTKVYTFQVSADYGADTTFVVNTEDTTFRTKDGQKALEFVADAEGNGWVDTIAYSKGKVKPNSTGYVSETDKKHEILKVFCKPGWAPIETDMVDGKKITCDMYSVNIKVAKAKMDEMLYSQIKSPRLQEGKRTEYYVYPYDAYSKLTHDKLMANGIIAARGGAKSGFALPGDFYQPFRIDFDAFFMLDKDASWTLSSPKGQENPHQRLSLQGLVDRVVNTKGYMIREFHACANVSNWEDANLQSKGGWWGGIPQSLYETHFQYLDKLIEAHKVVVYTPTEAVKYRLTANAVTPGTAAVTGEVPNGAEVSVKAGTLDAKYQDEISVIVKFATGDKNIKSASYSDGTQPRYAPVMMDKEGKAWSVSVNPYKLGGKVKLSNSIPNSVLNTEMKVSALKFVNLVDGNVRLFVPAGTYTAELYSVSGRKVGSASVTGTDAIVTTGLNTSDLASGMYFLTVKSNGASVMQQKLMIK